MSESRRPMEAARAGAGMRVTPQRLHPLGTTGGFFAIGLLTFALIPLWLMHAREWLIGGVMVHSAVVLLAHLYVLGWGTAVALGALQQIAVVLFQAPQVVAPKMGRMSLLLYFGGLLLLFSGFWIYRYELVGVGGTLLLIAFLLTVFSVMGSISRRERASRVLPFLLPALLCLVGVALAGVLMAVHPFTGILGGARNVAFAFHLFLGPLGWFGLLIPGISYELAPFFGLTRGGEDKGLGRFERPVASVLLFALLMGLVGAVVGGGTSYALILLALGYVLFLYDLRGIFRRRGIVRRTAILTGVRAGHLHLALLSVMMLVGAFLPQLHGDGRWMVAIGWIAAAGWISNSVAGYLHRILPFLAWHSRYWGASKESIRTRFQDMVSQRLGRIGFYVYNAGVLFVALGLWVPLLFNIGVVLLAVGTWMLVYNLARVYVR